MANRGTEANTKKKSNLGLIIGIIIAIVVVIIVVVIVVVVILIRRGASKVKSASNCSSDADCLFGFKCNTSTKVCSQCLTDADCSEGKVCVGPVCVCQPPTITSAVATVTQHWPPIITVTITPSTDPASTKFSAIFNGQSGYQVDSGFVSTPTIQLALSGTCGGPFGSYGCVANCGASHNVVGSIAVQIESQCGAKSTIKTIPLSGTCDICTATTC